MALLAELGAQGLDDGGLARAGDAGDAHADGLARVGEEPLDDVLGHGVVLGRVALHHGDGPGELHTVPGQHALHVVVDGHLGRAGGAGGVGGAAELLVALGDAGHDEAGELGVRLLLLVDPLGLIGGVFLWHGSLLFERKYLKLAPFLERKGA